MVWPFSSQVQGVTTLINYSRKAIWRKLGEKRPQGKFWFAWSFPLFGVLLCGFFILAQTSGEVQLCVFKISVTLIQLKIILGFSSSFWFLAQCTSETEECKDSIFVVRGIYYLIAVSVIAEKNNNILTR